MAYLLGKWETDRQVIAIARRLKSSIFDISLRTDCPATFVVRRSVARGQNNLVGMPLKIIKFLPDNHTTVSLHFDLNSCWRGPKTIVEHFKY